MSEATCRIDEGWEVGPRISLRSIRATRSSRYSLRRLNRRQRDRLDLGEVELPGGVLNVKTDNIAVGVEVHDEAVDNLARFGARRGLQLDVEAVRLRIVMQLHGLKLTSATSPHERSDMRD